MPPGARSGHTGGGLGALLALPIPRIVRRAALEWAESRNDQAADVHRREEPGLRRPREGVAGSARAVGHRRTSRAPTALARCRLALLAPW